MKQRRLFALLLAFVMTLGTTNAFAAGGFTDVPKDAYYISFDYDNVPAAKEAELTFRKMDPETWEPVETFESAKVTFTD